MARKYWRIIWVPITIQKNWNSPDIIEAQWHIGMSSASNTRTGPEFKSCKEWFILNVLLWFWLLCTTLFTIWYIFIPHKKATHQIRPPNPHAPMHHPRTDAMHGPACPSTKTQIRPHQTKGRYNYMILLLNNLGSSSLIQHHQGMLLGQPLWMSTN